MHISQEEKNILRALAREYSLCAQDPVNAEREARARRINGLTPDRPLIWIHEIPWNELNIDHQLSLRCTHPFAREMEGHFRRALMQWKYFQADMVLENCYRIRKAYDFIGCGLKVQEHVRVFDKENYIISHEYIDQLDSEEKLEQLRDPIVTARPDLDQERLEMAQDILEGILPVKLSGIHHSAVMWDDIARLRGVEAVYMDLAVNPDLMHATIRRFVEMNAAVIDQMDAQGLFTSDLSNLHCTPAWSEELEKIEKEKGPGAHATWYRGAAQSFGSISPDMHEEFEIDYILPLTERFGLTYYGCCEPLHDRIDKLTKIKNLRKIGVSPWADVWKSAEQMGSKYVLSRKPNPALVATASLDEDAIRKEIEETAKACIRYNCPCDITLKDISTAHYNIHNLSRWAQIAEEVLDQYYGK